MSTIETNLNLWIGVTNLYFPCLHIILDTIDQEVILGGPLFQRLVWIGFERLQTSTRSQQPRLNTLPYLSGNNIRKS